MKAGGASASSCDTASAAGCVGFAAEGGFAASLGAVSFRADLAGAAPAEVVRGLNSIAGLAGESVGRRIAEEGGASSLAAGHLACSFEHDFTAAEQQQGLIGVHTGCGSSAAG
jgi:hypothetical protein